LQINLILIYIEIMSEISKVEKNSTYLKILWNDGEEV